MTTTSATLPNPLGVHALVWAGDTSPASVEHAVVQTRATGFDLLDKTLAGDGIRAQSPFGRVATPEEVAAAVVCLAEPGAEWASGAVLDFNGASHLR